VGGSPEHHDPGPERRTGRRAADLIRELNTTPWQEGVEAIHQHLMPLPGKEGGMRTHRIWTGGAAVITDPALAGDIGESCSD